MDEWGGPDALDVTGASHMFICQKYYSYSRPILMFLMGYFVFH
jgi:hypothetical protein